MATDMEKTEATGEISQMENQPSDIKVVSGFDYQDPKTEPKKSALERRLVLKVDFLIVGLTSLVFLVNQWVSNHYVLKPAST
jgi:hypothetical protein